ncbi:UNVERIFIED_CONTAM: hypothetical protein Slati_0961200 [Sesamum latifolium]|uniref:Uncharacterized protein n=1 Tax=Sesamum latifolium TaxID=2727402 RepID=A0AAW2XQC1_9LAMI
MPLILLPSQSQLLNLHLRNQVSFCDLLGLCYSACILFDPGRVFFRRGPRSPLGEAEAEVTDAPGQMGSGVVAKKVFEEEPPAQEEDAQIEEKTPSVG